MFAKLSKSKIHNHTTINLANESMFSFLNTIIVTIIVTMDTNNITYFHICKGKFK